jgi:hypothetical protein
MKGFLQRGSPTVSSVISEESVRAGVLKEACSGTGTVTASTTGGSVNDLSSFGRALLIPSIVI